MTLQTVPSVGVLMSALIFHEAVNVSLVLGVLLITAGVLLTTVQPSSKWQAVLAARPTSTRLH